MSDKKDVEFLEAVDQKLVDLKDVFQKGDWVLKWSPSVSNETTTGFELYTPPEFNIAATKLPLGGTVLAALFFMLEHSDENFAGEMILRANQLSDRMKEEITDEKRTLN